MEWWVLLELAWSLEVLVVVGCWRKGGVVGHFWHLVLLLAGRSSCYMLLATWYNYNHPSYYSYIMILIP